MLYQSFSTRFKWKPIESTLMQRMINDMMDNNTLRYIHRYGTEYEVCYIKPETGRSFTMWLKHCTTDLERFMIQRPHYHVICEQRNDYNTYGA